LATPSQIIHHQGNGLRRGGTTEVDVLKQLVNRVAVPGQAGTFQVNRPVQRVSAGFANLLTDRAVAAADAEQRDLTGHVHVSLRWWEVADLTGTADSAGPRTRSATSTRARP